LGQGFIEFGTNIRARLFGLLGKLVGEMFGAPGTTAQLIETGEADTAVEPDSKRASIAAEAGSGGDQLEEGLLDRILGGGTISKHPEGEGGEAIDGGFVDHPVGGVGPSTDSVDH